MLNFRRAVMPNTTFSSSLFELVVLIASVCSSNVFLVSLTAAISAFCLDETMQKIKKETQSCPVCVKTLLNDVFLSSSL